MPTILDARGLPCPQPVLRTKQAMSNADDLVVLVSADDQVGNVRRLAERAGWQVSVERREDAHAIHIRKGAAALEPELTPDVTACAVPRGSVLLVAGEELGRGDATLGGILARSLFHTLTESDVLPRTLIFMNGGVKLAVDDSPVLEDLHTLEERGVEILACGTCLGHWNLKERLRVGRISNMYAIAEALLLAEHVVSL
ncbi:MAG: sulfurtransferase-like selenium metabolism protein YedF [Anaerolineae bacterium]